MTTSLGISSLIFFFPAIEFSVKSVSTSIFPIHSETQALGTNLMYMKLNQLASHSWVFVAQNLLLITQERLCSLLEKFQKSWRDNGRGVLRGKVPVRWSEKPCRREHWIQDIPGKEGFSNIPRALRDSHAFQEGALGVVVERRWKKTKVDIVNSPTFSSLWPWLIEQWVPNIFKVTQQAGLANKSGSIKSWYLFSKKDIGTQT